jgi:hypothetical protein
MGQRIEWLSSTTTGFRVYGPGVEIGMDEVEEGCLAVAFTYDEIVVIEGPVEDLLDLFGKVVAALQAAR